MLGSRASLSATAYGVQNTITSCYGPDVTKNHFTPERLTPLVATDAFVACRRHESEFRDWVKEDERAQNRISCPDSIRVVRKSPSHFPRSPDPELDLGYWTSSSCDADDEKEVYNGFRVSRKQRNIFSGPAAYSRMAETSSEEISSCGDEGSEKFSNNSRPGVLRVVNSRFSSEDEDSSEHDADSLRSSSRLPRPPRKPWGPRPLLKDPQVSVARPLYVVSTKANWVHCSDGSTPPLFAPLPTRPAVARQLLEMATRTWIDGKGEFGPSA